MLNYENFILYSHKYALQFAQQIFSDEIEEVNPARENTIHNSIFKL